MITAAAGELLMKAAQRMQDDGATQVSVSVSWTDADGGHRWRVAFADEVAGPGEGE